MPDQVIVTRTPAATILAVAGKQGPAGPPGSGGGGGGGAVDSVNGQTGTVVLGAADVGAATPASVTAKYTKPGTGIPKTDLEAAAQTSLTKADAALPAAQKGAANGVPSLDATSKLPLAQLTDGVSTQLDSDTLRGIKAQLALRSTAPYVIVGAGSSTTDQGWYLRMLHESLKAAYPVSSGDTNPAFTNLPGAVASPPKAPGIYMVKAGVAGTTASNYLTSTTRAQIAALAPKLIFHMIGANDYATGIPVATYKTTLISQLDAIDALMTTPHQHILISQHERYDAAALAAKVAPYADYSTAMKEVADGRVNALFIDARLVFSGVGIPPAAGNGNDPYGLMKQDLIHLRPAGHALLADTLRAKLEIPGPVSNGRTGTVFLSDSFNRANSTDFTGQTADAALGGTTLAWQSSGVAGWKINGNTLARGTASTSFLGLPVTQPDVEVSAIVSTLPNATSSDNFSIDIRRNQVSSVGATGYRLKLQSDGTLVLMLIGGATLDTSVDDIYKAGDRIGLRAKGTTIEALINGVVVISVVDATLSASAFVGFTASSAVTTFGLDDFLVSEITTGGGYTKPVTGIPATDLAAAVQTSLGKADSAVQPAALAAKADGLNGVTGIWQGTQVQYNALTPSSTVIYFIKG
jgi:lysophospholipase L1-like esterase